MTNQVNNNHNNGGVGFLGLLTIVLITLKLLGYITWSWWWVLSPLWLGFSVLILVLTIAFTVMLVQASKKG